MFYNDTFSRRGTFHTMSANAFNLALGFFLLWGFGLNWLMVELIPSGPIRAINSLVFLLGYFACGFSGCALISKSKNPAVSFIGYNLIVVPIGLVLVCALPEFAHEHIMAAVRVTTLLTVGMMVMGTLFPQFFQKIEGALSWALIISIVVQLVQMLIFGIHLGVVDWIVAAIFCGYIGVDWGRANRIERTPDNAVDSAASLYLDIINLFMRVLEIISRR
ncbi:Bax inhibitor-1 family protein [Pseudomonas sp. LS-2]|uniref:Bax inhibitor-1 family protein n=1 Tax=Pseudomonas sp. LS-2 TaxID=2315859 RepID=UPI000E70F0AB|nr:Bax inhibitor-1 family protein [Pseudomonas sp. LS-2]RJX78951.1 hypothetical protein D3M70_16210 [Pseudomonas sp. LS-2]